MLTAVNIDNSAYLLALFLHVVKFMDCMVPHAMECIQLHCFGSEACDVWQYKVFVIC